MRRENFSVKINLGYSAEPHRFLTSILCMSGMNFRSCTTSMMDPPAALVTAHKADKLPGLSLITTLNRNKRPTAIRPRSRQRPKRLVSMFPPQSMATTLVITRSIRLGHTAGKKPRWNSPFVFEFAQLTRQDSSNASGS